jgi:hypothetical protein
VVVTDEGTGRKDAGLLEGRINAMS